MNLLTPQFLNGENSDIRLTTSPFHPPLTEIKLKNSCTSL